MVVKALKAPSWTEAMQKNDWTPAVLTGAEFEKFVDEEFARLRATMAKAGMV
jgi:putative tricarboxylic transport membrane protein